MRPRYVARPQWSDFRRFGERQRIINIDTEISNGVFDLAVPKQDLDGPKIAGSLVDRCGFGAA